MTALSPVQSRLAALALLALTLAALHFAVVAPYLERYRQAHDRIEGLAVQLGRYEQVVEMRPAVIAELDALERRRALEREYLAGETVALASAELQEHLKAVIDGAGGRLISTQVLAAQAHGTIQPVIVRVTLRGGVETLLQVAHALESERPYLMLDNVAVRSLGAQRRRRVATPEELDIRFDVTAHIRSSRP